jgi:dolichyl-diphosphooligosaccharide---protein glycosyltransferase
MQFIAVFLKRYVIQARMSLNDICCYMPAWFGVLTTFFTGAIAYEATLPLNRNIYSYLVSSQPPLSLPSTSFHRPALECAILTAGMMAIIPAHLMRSVGGGYDNESVAITAMVLTFYLWMRSLRVSNSMTTTVLTAIGTGLAYFYMVAAWGGYVFVLNLIGVHAAVLVALGRYTPQVHAAYSIFYFLGTALAVQIPVVGWVPLKSLEQLGPCAVFIGYQLLFVTEYIIQQRRKSSDKPFTWMQAMVLRVQVVAVALFALFFVAVMMLPTGYFGPISSRVRGLFVRHTKTGNPLVDSVAEHQPASTRAYFDYLHHICSLAPIGYLLTGLLHMSDASSFLLVWGAAAYYFSLKMVRLVLLTAPIACILAGIVVGRLWVWCVAQWGFDPEPTAVGDAEEEEEAKEIKGKDKRVKKKTTKKSSSADAFSIDGLDKLRSAIRTFANSKEGVISKRVASVLLLLAGYIVLSNFVDYSWRLSFDLSHPTIIQRGRTRDGAIVTLDDYREAYWWIRDNTPNDARIMAWWDCTSSNMGSILGVLTNTSHFYRHFFLS